MNAIEPIADAVTGGLVARALEPQSGVDSTGHTTERACLNCRTPLVGDYCHACGQKGHVHRSLGAFGHDLLHGVFHFEGKVWRTLPMLAWRPGELTRRYIEGERATFVGPLPLFLFCVFLMFAVVSQAAHFNFNPEKVQEQVGKNIQKEEARLKELEASRAAAAAAGQETARLDSQIEEGRNDVELARAIAKDGVVEGSRVRMANDVTAMPRSLDQAWRKAKANPELLLFKVKSNGYKYSWALIPLSLPLMWLLFPFSRRWRMYDHTVFVTYSLCFMTLLVVAGSLWRLTGYGGTALLLLVPPVHMYRQLRGAYGLGRFSALWRASIMCVGALTIACLFVAGLLALGTFA